jgi:hypothetical protein
MELPTYEVISNRGKEIRDQDYVIVGKCEGGGTNLPGRRDFSWTSDLKLMGNLPSPAQGASQNSLFVTSF